MQNITQQFKAWVRTKPANETYDYTSNKQCAFCQFLRAAGYPVADVIPGVWIDTDSKAHVFAEEIETAVSLFNFDLPNGGRTFGALADRLDKLEV